ncbi:hypothetical protein Bca101_043757 [Brassica carinata]
MSVVPAWISKLHSGVNAILSSEDWDNLPVINPGDGAWVDRTSVTWFKFCTRPLAGHPGDFFEKAGFTNGRLTASFQIILRNKGFLYSL